MSVASSPTTSPPRAGRRGEARACANSADRDERADHEHVAVGEVDQLDDAVDERVAERDQRPDRAVGEAVDEVLADAREVAVVRAGPLIAVVDRSASRTTISPYCAQERPDRAGSPAGWTLGRLAAVHCVFAIGRRAGPRAAGPPASERRSAVCALTVLSNVSSPSFDLVDAVVGQRRVAVLVDRVGAEHALAVLGGEQRLEDFVLVAASPARLIASRASFIAS